MYTNGAFNYKNGEYTCFSRTLHQPFTVAAKIVQTSARPTLLISPAPAPVSTRPAAPGSGVTEFPRQPR